MGGLARYPTPNLEDQGFLSGCPSLSHNIPLFERRRIPAFAVVSKRFRGVGEQRKSEKRNFQRFAQYASSIHGFNTRHASKTKFIST